MGEGNCDTRPTHLTRTGRSLHLDDGAAHPFRLATLLIAAHTSLQPCGCARPLLAFKHGLLHDDVHPHTRRVEHQLALALLARLPLVGQRGRCRARLERSRFALLRLLARW